MNENGTKDKALLALVERLLRQRIPSGHPLLDDLAQTAPRPDPGFQQELEERLMAALTEKQEQTNMQQYTYNTDFSRPMPQTNHRVRLPLTLAAAVLAVFVAGVMMLGSITSGGGSYGAPQDGGNGSAQIAALSTNDAIRATQTALAHLQADLQQTQQALQGLITATATTTPTPTVTATTTPTSTVAATPLLVTATPLPTVVMMPIMPTITAFSPESGYRPVIVASGLLRGATITANDLVFTFFPADAVPSDAVTDPETVLNLYLQRDINGMQILTFSLVGEENPLGTVPPGMVAVDAPAGRLSSLGDNLRPGDAVHILAALWFVDADASDFQELQVAPLSPGVTIESGELRPGALRIAQPDAAEGGEAPSLIIQRVAVGEIVEIIAGETDIEAVIVLAVSPDDAAILNYLLEARVPLILLDRSDMD